MQIKSSNFLVIISALLLFACNDPKRDDHAAFYFWKTKYELTPLEKNALFHLKCEKLYVRMFDVVWDAKSNMPTPIAKLTSVDTLNRFIIIPVTYFKNEVFVQIADSAINALAFNTAQLFNKMAINRNFTFTEFQIDCDWSEGTKIKYFAFLKAIKKQLNDKTLNCTLRLHQIKYKEKTGIPPVDKGLLMFYNMGKMSTKTGLNSIFNEQDANKYASYIKRYPMRLDAALPIISWALHCRRGKVLQILPRRDLSDFGDTSLFLYNKGLIYVKKDTIYKGIVLQRNDFMKVETVFEEDCIAAAKILAKNAPKNGFENIVFFDLDEKTITRFNHEKINDIHAILP